MLAVMDMLFDFLSEQHPMNLKCWRNPWPCANAQMSREWLRYQRHCSVLPPIIDLTHCTETKQLRQLNNRQCQFDNGFNVVQNHWPCSKAPFPGEPQTVQHHLRIEDGVTQRARLMVIFASWSSNPQVAVFYLALPEDSNARCCPPTGASN